MPYIGNTPAEKYAAFNVQHFTTSATTSYTLDRAVANELDIRLVINNVIQQPGVGKAYTASGTTLTLSGATTGTDTMYAVYIGKAVQTVNPPAGSVDEATLQVSNSPVNGYVLSAQSAAAGGLTWAADAAGTITAFTNGVDNRLVTATSATALNGEANLNFDGSQLTIPTGSAGAPSLAHAGDTDTGIYFATNGINFATAGNNRVELLSDGNLSIRQESLKFETAGKGVYLGTTTGAAANLLDDYEEGIWTPNVANATVSSSTGHYTKIGNICYITIQLALSAIGSGNPSQISGLPFAANATSNRMGLIGMVDSRNNSTSTVELHLRSDTNSSLLIFVGKESDVANYDDDLNVMADSFSVNGSGWYTTA